MGKSATSAPRSVTLPATAQRLVATVAVSAEDKADTEADVEVDTVVDKEDRSATPAARLDISQETAQLRTTTSVLATSASSQVTSRLSAPTKLPSRKDTLRT